MVCVRAFSDRLEQQDLSNLEPSSVRSSVPSDGVVDGRNRRILVRGVIRVVKTI